MLEAHGQAHKRVEETTKALDLAKRNRADTEQQVEDAYTRMEEQNNSPEAIGAVVRALQDDQSAHDAAESATKDYKAAQDAEQGIVRKEQERLAAYQQEETAGVLQRWGAQANAAEGAEREDPRSNDRKGTGLIPFAPFGLPAAPSGLPAAGSAGDAASGQALARTQPDAAEGLARNPPDEGEQRLAEDAPESDADDVGGMRVGSGFHPGGGRSGGGGAGRHFEVGDENAGSDGTEVVRVSGGSGDIAGEAIVENGVEALQGVGKADVDATTQTGYNDETNRSHITEVDDIAKAPQFSQLSDAEIERIAKEYRARAPVEIPESATYNAQSKTGYEQIRYQWDDSTYRYEARWHTRTPGAPADQGNTWVMQRRLPGQRGVRAITEILVGDTWVPKYVWHSAIEEYQNGTATEQQLRLLEKGHFKEE